MKIKKSSLAPVYNQCQTYNGKTYSVASIIESSRNIPVEYIEVRFINKYHNIAGITNADYDLEEFVTSMKRVLEADLKYPILLYRGFVIDGKHRLTKAIYLGKKKIKVKVLEKLPTETS